MTLYINGKAKAVQYHIIISDVSSHIKNNLISL